MAMNTMWSCIPLACLVTLTLLFSVNAQAEPYVAAQAGVTFPGDLTNVEGIQTLQGVKTTDLALKTSMEEGIKIGYFLPGSLKWLGVETEAFYTNPHLKQQAIMLSGSVGGQSFAPFSSPIDGAHVRMATWAVNLIARYPGVHFQPYAGVGLGIFWARVSGNSANGIGTASDTSPGLNVLAGLRYLVSRHLGVFTEYKYNRATFDFGQDGGPFPVDTKADYTAHHVVFGVGYHF